MDGDDQRSLGRLIAVYGYAAVIEQLQWAAQQDATASRSVTRQAGLYVTLQRRLDSAAELAQAAKL